jgi:excisionase family DNA binding protein
MISLEQRRCRASVTNPPHMRSPPPLQDPLLDANEAARLLNVPRGTIYELVRSRGLPHVRIGKRGLRFTRAGLSAWVADNSHGAARD